MYAVIRDSGRQIKVENGQEFQVDYRDADVGSEVTFADVLAVSDGTNLTIGKPVVKGAVVRAEVLGVEQGPKLVVQKFRRRKNSKRRTGHRQIFTKVRISSIKAS